MPHTSKFRPWILRGYVAFSTREQAAFANRRLWPAEISRRAARSSDGAFRKALDKMPDVEPEEYDRLDK